MQYHGNILCVTYAELTQDDRDEESGNDARLAPIMSRDCYHKLVARNQIEVVRRGRGRGVEALIAYESLPMRYKEKAEQKYGKGNAMMMTKIYDRHYAWDETAASYYAEYTTPTGAELDSATVREYAANASALRAIISLMDSANMQRQASREKKARWEDVAGAVDYYRMKYGHTLPDSPARLRDKVTTFKREGYSCLVSGKYGNSNTLRVSDDVSRVLLSLATRGNQPYAEQVYEDYNAFVRGELEVVDTQTGEVFDCTAFRDKRGNPLTLSKRTVDSYLTKPSNQVLINATRKSWATFYHEDMPHLHRHVGQYSLSKITADDRDLPRMEKGTKQRPKAYYVYDVLSGCVLGHAYSHSKDIDLVTDMFREMFRFLHQHNLGIPAQIEVENHLMTQWKDSFLRAGEVFDYVRFCAPQNSQEKHAEPFNGAKKKAVEHRYQHGIGRWYAKNGAYRTEYKKVSDANNDTYEARQYYTWEELVADDLWVIEMWNNMPHHDQKRFPGKTRMQVLMEHLNPALKPYAAHKIARYIGEHTATSIRRNDYCRVRYNDYHISSPAVLDKLRPGNLKVDAYWLPEEGKPISEVYIYQNGVYIDTLKPIETYNEFIAERTPEDWRIMQEQLARRERFAAWVAANTPAPVTTLTAAQAEAIAQAEEEAEEVTMEMPVEEVEEVAVDVMSDEARIMELARRNV